MPGSSHTSIPSPLHAGAQPVPSIKSSDEGRRAERTGKTHHSFNREMSIPDRTSASMVSERDIQSTTLSAKVQALADATVSDAYDEWLLSVSFKLAQALEDPETRFDQDIIQSIKAIFSDDETILLIENNHRNTQLEEERYLEFLSNLKERVDSAIQSKYPEAGNFASLKKTVHRKLKRNIAAIKRAYGDDKSGAQTIIRNIINRTFYFPKDRLHYTAGEPESLRHTHRKTQTLREFPERQHRDFGTSPSHPLRANRLAPPLSPPPSRPQSEPDLSSPEKSRYGTGYGNGEERMSPKKHGSLPTREGHPYDPERIREWLRSSQSSIGRTIPPEHRLSDASAKSHRRHLEDTHHERELSIGERVPESSPKPYLGLSSRQQESISGVASNYASTSSVDGISPDVPDALQRPQGSLPSDRFEFPDRAASGVDPNSMLSTAESRHRTPESPSQSHGRLSSHSTRSIHSDASEKITAGSYHHSVGSHTTSHNSLSPDELEFSPRREELSHDGRSYPEPTEPLPQDDNLSTKYPESMSSKGSGTNLSADGIGGHTDYDYKEFEGEQQPRSAYSWPLSPITYIQPDGIKQKSRSLSELPQKGKEPLRDAHYPFSHSFSGATLIPQSIQHASCRCLTQLSSHPSSGSHILSPEEDRPHNQYYASEEKPASPPVSPGASRPGYALTLHPETDGEGVPSQVESPSRRSISHDAANNMTSHPTMVPVQSQTLPVFRHDYDWAVEGHLSRSRRNSLEAYLMASDTDSASEYSESESEYLSHQRRDMRPPARSDCASASSDWWDDKDVALPQKSAPYNLETDIMLLTEMIHQTHNMRLHESPVTSALKLLETSLAHFDEESASTTIISFRELLIELTQKTKKQATIILARNEEHESIDDEETPDKKHEMVKSQILEQLSYIPKKIEETPSAIIQRNTTIINELINVINQLQAINPAIADPLEREIKQRIVATLSEGLELMKELELLKGLNKSDGYTTGTECEEIPLDGSPHPRSLLNLSTLSKTSQADEEDSLMSTASDMKSDHDTPIPALTDRSTWNSYLPTLVRVESSDEHKPHESGETDNGMFEENTYYDFRQANDASDNQTRYQFRQTTRDDDEHLEVHIIANGSAKAASMPSAIHPYGEDSPTTTPEKRPRRQSVAERLKQQHQIN